MTEPASMVRALGRLGAPGPIPVTLENAFYDESAAFTPAAVESHPGNVGFQFRITRSPLVVIYGAQLWLPSAMDTTVRLWRGAFADDGAILVREQPLVGAAGWNHAWFDEPYQTLGFPAEGGAFPNQHTVAYQTSGSMAVAADDEVAAFYPEHDKTFMADNHPAASNGYQRGPPIAPSMPGPGEPPNFGITRHVMIGPVAEYAPWSVTVNRRFGMD